MWTDGLLEVLIEALVLQTLQKEVGAVKSIRVEHQPSPERLAEMGVESWPVWTKEVSEFPWTYDEDETCYFLEGEVEVAPTQGPPVRVAKGDLVTFPAGLQCTWKVLQPVRKRYRFG